MVLLVEGGKWMFAKVLENRIINHDIIEQQPSTTIPSTQKICGICRDDMLVPTVVYRCGHLFCYECAVEWIGRKGKCPVCRVECGVRDCMRLEGY